MFGLGLCVVVAVVVVVVGVVGVVGVAGVVGVVSGVDAGNSVASLSARAGDGVVRGPLRPRRLVGGGMPGVPPKPLSL